MLAFSKMKKWHLTCGKRLNRGRPESICSLSFVVSHFYDASLSLFLCSTAFLFLFLLAIWSSASILYSCMQFCSDRRGSNGGPCRSAWTSIASTPVFRWFCGLLTCGSCPFTGICLSLSMFDIYCRGLLAWVGTMTFSSVALYHLSRYRSVF